MLQDVRIAIRSLVQQPGFSVLAILIVALGAGANASVFSVVRAVLLQPLPYAQPDRLVALWPEGFISNADLEFMRSRLRGFSAVGSVSPGWTMSLMGAGEPLRVTGAKTSANVFDLLGVRAAIGRTLRAGDDTPGQHRVVVLSDSLWRTRFDGDPRAIGRFVTLEDAPHEVVGVMPADFEILGRDAELWLPLPFDVTSPFYKGTTSQAIGRLRDTVDVEAAAREIRSLVPDWRRQLGYADDWGQARTVAPLRDVVAGDVRRPLLVLLGAVGLIVVLTATNLGTLLLGRQVARRRETAVRTALGATSWRLARQSAVESLVVAIPGAAAGVLVAGATLPALLRLLPPEMPRVAAIAIDPVVLAVVLVTSSISVLLCGVVPAFASGRAAFARTASGGIAIGLGRGDSRTLHGLVVGQIALALVLGVGAALMARSLLALNAVDPGFDPTQVLTLKLQPSGERYRGVERTLAYYRAVMERVAAVPGVVSVGAINHLPLSGYDWTSSIRIDERPLPAGVSPPTVGWRMIDGAYFESMGISLRVGRTFSTHDTRDSPLVTIVNESFARRFFGDAASALGRTIRSGSASGEQLLTIVGIVGDVRHRALAEEPRPEMYRPIAQAFAMASALVVRTHERPAGAIAAVREAVWSVDRNVAIADLLPLTTLLRDSLGRPRLIATLLLVFAASGLAIVLSGVYGVVAYSVRRRERDMGIRLALGAAPAAVARLVLSQGLLYAAGGIALGVPLALALSGSLRGLLFAVQPRDPATIAGLCGIVAVATVAATLGPARRAVRIDPAVVLKAD